MGCGKSKHDVVTGNTTKVRKPSEPESVKGKESESIIRQESCRCRKKNEISTVISGDQPETTVENDTKKPEEKQDGGDCGEKLAVEMTNGDIIPEEKETTTTLTAVTAIMPENIVTEETINEVNVAPIDEQKEEINMETVVEKQKSFEENNDDDVDSKIPSPEVEEPKLDEQTPATESEVQEIPTTENEEITKESDETTVFENEKITKENDEITAVKNEEIEKETDETAAAENKEIAKENDEIAVVENEEITKENDEIAVAENEEITKENDDIAAAENEEIAATENNENTTKESEETPALEDEVVVDAVQESPVDIAK